MVVFCQGKSKSRARRPEMQTKKPDASHTHCVKVQPRTCSWDVIRNAQQNTKTQSSCAGISTSGAKKFKKLGWFSHNFAEISIKWAQEPKSHKGRPRFQCVMYTTFTQKSSQKHIVYLILLLCCLGKKVSKSVIMFKNKNTFSIINYF